MTTLATDNYTRANQSGWGLASDGTNTWSTLRGASTFAISSNTGTVVNFSNSYCVEQCGSVTSANSDQVVTFTRSSTADLAGIVARVGDANNWYAANIGEFANNLVVSKFVAGSYSDIAFGPNATFATGTTWSIRFRVIGTSLKARIWDASGAEPSTWDIDTTDTSLSAAGGIGVVVDPVSSSPVTFTAYNATDGSSTTTSSRTVPATAALFLTSSRTMSATAALIATETRTVPTSAALIETQQRVVPTSAALLATESRVVPSSAALETTNTRTIPVSAALLATLHRTIPCTAALSGVSVVPPTNATFYVRGGQATFYVRSGEATFFVREK